jgi:hypothetical protein
MFKLRKIEETTEYVKYEYIGDDNISGTVIVHKVTGLITIDEHGRNPFIYHIRKRMEKYYKEGNYPDSGIIAIY